jgi:hypothetical protein
LCGKQGITIVWFVHAAKKAKKKKTVTTRPKWKSVGKKAEYSTGDIFILLLTYAEHSQLHITTLKETMVVDLMICCFFLLADLS